MINSLIQSISISLNAEFGDNFAIYMDSVEQGLREPCFFVFCINQACRLFFGKRYCRSHQFVIQFFPSDRDCAREECYAAAERLYSCLEYLTVGTDLIRGSDMHGGITDGVLHFFVSYNFFVDRQEDSTETMDALGGVGMPGA